MKILVINAGSSSLKYRFFHGEKQLIKGHIDAINLKNCEFNVSLEGVTITKPAKIKDHKAAFKIALDSLIEYKIIKSIKEIDAVGHRFVHGGEKFKKSVKITDTVIKEMKKLSKLAPLHNPHNLTGILACKKLLPKVKQVAVFDTSFHRTIPEKAYMYGLPYEFYKKDGYRRYGFHGPSHEYVSKVAIKYMKKKKSKIISCHLGNGCSITAIKNGESIDTTMGFTPTAGTMMGTRTGDIDPMLSLILAEKYGIEKTKDILNNKSGLLGIAGKSDMRDVHNLNLKGNKKAKLAEEMFSYQVALRIGAFTNIMSGLDTLIFTGGIGENAYFVREKICEYLKWMGLSIDKTKNNKSLFDISGKNSKIYTLIIPTNEELIIVKETKFFL
ncbi:acetate kinase [Desulfosarcina sp.]|nr:acetate kinase [Desulfosarcina sp.]